MTRDAPRQMRPDASTDLIIDLVIAPVRVSLCGRPDASTPRKATDGTH